MDAGVTINHKSMRRAAARLMSLAVLAERASYRCFVIRCLVLWILRPAESYVEAYIGELVASLTGAPALFVDNHAIGNDPDDAIRLAERFRALAAMLDQLSRLALIELPAWSILAADARRLSWLFDLVSARPNHLAREAVQANDTS